MSRRGAPPIGVLTPGLTHGPSTQLKPLKLRLGWSKAKLYPSALQTTVEIVPPVAVGRVKGNVPPAGSDRLEIRSKLPAGVTQMGAVRNGVPGGSAGTVTVTLAVSM